MERVTVKTTNADEEIGFMDISETDFHTMNTSQRIQQLEVEGYVLLPDMLDSGQISRLKKELACIPMECKDYSECQTYCLEAQWRSSAMAELIGHPPMIDFLTALMGPDIVFTRGLFTRTLPGSPPISMHTDGQPYGSSIFSYEGSSPRLVRVLYYLDDLPPKRAPFRIVPRSHLSFHADANPYVRYKSHPQEITICAKAGSALIIPKDVFHGTHPNRDVLPRELIQFGYRPAWSGPVQPMEEWDPEDVAAAPVQAQKFLKSVNTTGMEWQQPHKPVGMESSAVGINPDRWGK